jgi:hypothetical protein
MNHIRIAVVSLFILVLLHINNTVSINPNVQTISEKASAISYTSSCNPAYASCQDQDHSYYTTSVEARSLSPKAMVLQRFLAKYNSPLQYHAQDFVDTAEKYDLDWRLVASISGVESTFGKHIPGGYNGWGWGGSNLIMFDSWSDAIETISSTLKRKYVDKGLKDPYQMNRIYAASPTWGTRVDYFMRQIIMTEQNTKIERLYLEDTPYPQARASASILAVGYQY